MRLLMAVGLCALPVMTVCADSLDVTLNEGDAIPAFEAPTLDGKVWKSADEIGKGYVVIYFYPADLTGGCTKQACAFRDHQDELEACGAQVIGISGDPVKNHELFVKTHSLKFQLLSDEDGRIAKSFGVPLRDGATITRDIDGVEQSLTRGVTASRWTFVVGPDGRVVYKDTAVKAEEDCQNVLKIVRRLTASAE